MIFGVLPWMPPVPAAFPLKVAVFVIVSLGVSLQ